MSSYVTNCGKIPTYQSSYKFFKLLSICLITYGHSELFKLTASWVRTDLRGVPRRIKAEKHVKFLWNFSTESGTNQAQSMTVMVMKMTAILIIHRISNFESRTLIYWESKTEQDRKPKSVFGVPSLRQNPSVSIQKMQHKGVISCIILW